MSWTKEHGIGYAVPEIVTNNLVDISWHNDACPEITDYEAINQIQGILNGCKDGMCPELLDVAKVVRKTNREVREC